MTMFIYTLSVTFAVTHITQAVINLQGCTEAFIQMQCPDDDIIHVYDMRFSEVDQGHPCFQKKPAADVVVPTDLGGACHPGNDTTDGHTCVYVENICQGQNECTFYVSPHLINTKEKPGINSEIIINYECVPGTKRQGEIAVAALVATGSILSLLVIGGLLLWRILTQDPSTYADFTNDRIPPRTTASSSGVTNYAISPDVASGTSGAQASAAKFEEISVELRTPTPGPLPKA